MDFDKLRSGHLPTPQFVRALINSGLTKMLGPELECASKQYFEEANGRVCYNFLRDVESCRRNLMTHTRTSSTAGYGCRLQRPTQKRRL